MRELHLRQNTQVNIFSRVYHIIWLRTYCLWKDTHRACRAKSTIQWWILCGALLHALLTYACMCWCSVHVSLCVHMRLLECLCGHVLVWISHFEHTKELCTYIILMTNAAYTMRSLTNSQEYWDKKWPTRNLSVLEQSMSVSELNEMSSNTQIIQHTVTLHCRTTIVVLYLRWKYFVYNSSTWDVCLSFGLDSSIIDEWNHRYHFSVWLSYDSCCL